MPQNYTEQFAEIWQKCPSDFPRFDRLYSDESKSSKENEISHFLNKFKGGRVTRLRKLWASNQVDSPLICEARRVLSQSLGFTDAQLDLLFSDDLFNFTKSFVLKARLFDTELSVHDIFQACRNAWIMAGLQLIMGFPVLVTSSVFAYSMLYPYSDNLIDNPWVSTSEKAMFSNRFKLRLEGVPVLPASSIESKFHQLIGLIEEEYDRSAFPEVYESLLDIHDAQTKSISLVHAEGLLSEDEILNICIGKGGTSVLADGYLIAGKLTSQQRYFLFGFGAYLQLLDDLQDLSEDTENQLKTAFSSKTGLTNDMKFNKTYWFGEEVMKGLAYFDGKQIDVFRSLMKRSLDLFMAESLAFNEDHFPRQFVAELERHAPVHFTYLRSLNEQLTLNKSLITGIFDEITSGETV